MKPVRLFGGSASAAAVAPPTLHLSGPKLRRALETLVAGAEAQGGVERWVQGLRFKAAVFHDALEPGTHGALDEHTFLALTAMMPSVRRRIGQWLAANGYLTARALVQELLTGAADTAGADTRTAAFCQAFPPTREYRYARDLAAELLHWTHYEAYPLMTRWVWDQAAASGVLREIWHDDADPDLNLVPDGYETFLALREELAQYLTENGFFRDVPFYVDLLCAQVYSSYICEQGGTYLRAEFASEQDPMQYTRRMLGLDGIELDTGATRTRLGDGRAFVLDTSEPKH